MTQDVIDKIINIQFKYSDLVEGWGKTAQAIDENKKAIKKLNKEDADYYQKLAKHKTELRELNKQRKQYEREIDSNIKLEKAEKGSLAQLRASVKSMTAEYENMNAAARRSSQGKELLKNIRATTAEINKEEVALRNYRNNVGNYAGGIQKAFAKIGTAWMAVKGVYSLFSSAINTIKDFEQANANLGTILGASKAEMDALRESALELGRTTEYTASQVTMLQTELAKLGFGPQSIQAMQAPILNFATAVGAQLPEAAKLAGATLRIFGLNANETEDALDVLAASTNKSALSFDYLNTALSIVGPVAKTFGFSVRDTTALLGSLANSGFDASSAATATRNILLNLADTNGKLAKSLGGPVKTIPELVEGLKKLRAQGIDLAGTLELTDKRSVAAFNTFLNGADSINELRDAFEDVGGTAKNIAEERLNTVEGSIKLMKSAWEGLVLSFYESRGVIKSVIDGVTSLITGVTELIGPSEDLVSQLDKQADYVVRLVDDIQPLAEEYDTLKGKLSLSADEQERLKTLTQQLGDAYPLAITQIDEYGNAIDINTGKIYDNIAAEKARLKTLNKDAIEELEENIREQEEIIEDAQKKITSGKKEVFNPLLGAFNFLLPQWKELTAEEIKNLQDEVAEAAEARLGYMTELKKRNGQEIEEIMNAERERRAARLAEEKKTAEELAKQRAGLAAKQLSEKELKAKNKAAKELIAIEDKLRTTILSMRQDTMQKEIELSNQRYAKEREQLAHKLRTDKNLTLKSQGVINHLLIVLEEKRLKEESEIRAKWSEKEFEEEVRNEQNRIKMRINAQNKLQSLNVKQSQIENFDALSTTDPNRLLEKNAAQFKLAQEQQAAAENKLAEIQSMSEETYEVLYGGVLKWREAELDAQLAVAKAKQHTNDVQLQGIKLQEQETQMALQSAQQMIGALGDMAEAAGASAEVSAMLAIAESVAAMGIALSKAFSTSATIWDGIAGAVAAIATITTIITQIKSLNSSAASEASKYSFAGGGLITGPGTGTSDSITARVSNGEAVMTSAAVADWGAVLSAMNVSSGGNAIDTSNLPRRSGGGMEQMEEMMTRALMKMPRPVVSVVDINQGQNRVKVSQNLARMNGRR